VSEELASHGFANLRTWPRGIDADVFNPRYRSDELRRSWGADQGTVVVAYVGRVAKEKGIDVAIDALARLRARLADSERRVRFVVVGDGPHETATRARAPKGTVVLGRLTGTHLSAAYASADVQVFPSTTDTFGNVLLEGMASGLAVIAAGVPQSREVCANNAVFFTPGDSADLTGRLRRLVENRAERDALRVAALAHAKGCAWDVVFDALFADYEAVVRAAAVAGRIEPSEGRRTVLGNTRATG
jgi:glycosyltransferase involved in cell wall biosynthesis